MKNKYWVVYINEDDSDWVNVTFPDIPGYSKGEQYSSGKAISYTAGAPIDGGGDIPVDEYFNNCKSIKMSDKSKIIEEYPNGLIEVMEAGV